MINPFETFYEFKLRVEFMGGIAISEEDFLSGDFNMIDNPTLEVHTVDTLKSWDRIMPVVTHINMIDDYAFTVRIESMDVTIYESDGGIFYTTACKYQPDELLYSVYEAVIWFIDWYNTKYGKPSDRK